MGSEIHGTDEVERRRAREALAGAANRFDRAYPELREEVRDLYAAVAEAIRRAEGVRSPSDHPLVR